MPSSHRICEATHAETAREMDRRGEVIERLETDIAAKVAEITRLRADVERMREALTGLTFEVGSLGAFALEIRMVAGSTNYACLMQRYEAARAALEQEGT
jgi:hypothetical protein